MENSIVYHGSNVEVSIPRITPEWFLQRFRIWFLLH